MTNKSHFNRYIEAHSLDFTVLYYHHHHQNQYHLTETKLLFSVYLGFLKSVPVEGTSSERAKRKKNESHFMICERGENGE